MTTPTRIQRQRTKGWKAPQGAVYVGRGTKWGNPYRLVGKLTPADLVTGYELAIRSGYDYVPGPAEIRAELRGKDLMCWCPLDQPCHADVLLRIANADDSRDG